MASSGTSAGRKLLFASVAALGFLGLVEGAVRLTGVVSSAVYASPKGLTWAMRPNSRDHRLQTTDGMQFQVSTNSLGLRTPYEPGTAHEGTKTMVFLGDSIIFGWGVADHGSLPAQVEQAIPSMGVSQPWRVVNGGQPGYSSAQSYMLLRELGLQLEPDLVFLELAGHNQRSASKSDLEIINGRSSAVSGVLEHLHLYRLLKRAIRPEVAGGKSFWNEHDDVWGQGPAQDQDSSEIRVPPRDLARILEDLGELGREHGFTTVVNQPAFYRQPTEAVQAALQEAHDRGDVIWLDCGYLISQAGLNNPSWWVDDAYHWSIPGAQRAGRLTVECLAQAGLLD